MIYFFRISAWQLRLQQQQQAKVSCCVHAIEASIVRGCRGDNSDHDRATTGGMGGGFFSRAEKHLHGNEGLTSGEENDVKLPEHDSLSSNELAAATARAIVPQQYASYA